MIKLPSEGRVTLGSVEREQYPVASLRARLSDAGMSQAELARKIGAGEASVSRWVNGLTPGARTRKKIARTLGATEEQIWTLEE